MSYLLRRLLFWEVEWSFWVGIGPWGIPIIEVNYFRFRPYEKPRSGLEDEAP